MDAPFELIVEVEPNTVSTIIHYDKMIKTSCFQWRYFGRYVTRLFQGYEMKLSEWMMLDEQVAPILPLLRAGADAFPIQIKTIFCSRLAAQRLSNGQQTSYASQAVIRQNYDSGEWNIPCYSLECVGYDMALYEALTASAAMLRCEQEVSISKTQTLGKRRRTETPTACEVGDESAKEGSMKNARVEVAPDGVGEVKLTPVKGDKS